LEKAAEATRKYIAMQPNDPLGHFNLGLGLKHLKKPDEAIASFRLGIDRLGKPLVGRSDLETASLNRKAQFERNRTAPASYSEIGLILSHQNKLGEALAELEKGLKFDANVYELQYNLGFVHRRLRHPGPAIAAHRRALDLRPRSAEAWAGLGKALQLGRDL